MIEKFDGHFVPEELPNTLVKHHNITAKASTDAADGFINSGKEAEAMGDNRILKYRDTLGATQKIQSYAEVYEADEPAEKSGQQSAQVQLMDKSGQVIPIPQNKGLKSIPIPLTKNKEAYFAYPEDMSANDVKLVESQLKVILMRIEFDNEESNKNPAS